MPEVIGFVKEQKSYKHRKICPYCGAIVEFFDTEIIIDTMGMCVVCPNCNKDIKF